MIKIQIDKPSFVSELEVKLRPEMVVVTLSGKGEPMEYFDPKIEELRQFLQSKNINEAGPTLGIYHRDRREVGVDNVVWDAAIPIAQELTPSGDIQFQVLEPAQVSSVILTGGYDLIGPAIEYMEATLRQQHIDWRWPLTEIYHEEKGTLVTELQYFIDS